MTVIIILGVVIFLALCYYVHDIYNTFNKYGISHIKPIPLLGNMMSVLTRKRHMAELLDEIYFASPDERFTGRYDFLTPVLQIHDLELIKDINIRDFEFFIDHQAIVDENMEPCFGRSLFSLKGQEWKDMRATLSPAFTSCKIRAMAPLIAEISEQMIRVLKQRIESSRDGNIQVECKDLMNRYANDVIASCAFGVKVDSHTEVDNEFFKNGNEIGTFTLKSLLVIMGYQTSPTLMKKIKVRLLSKRASDFFVTLVENNMKRRELHNIIRHDMIHVIMMAKKGTLIHEKSNQTGDAGFATAEESELGTRTVNRNWSDTDLIAQAVFFFLAAFESVSSAMSSFLYELAVNPDIQERLVQEIMENEKRNGGKFDYNSIQNLKYLDMVVSEVLRLWPPVIVHVRKCVKDYNIGRANAKAKNDYIVRKGEVISIPAWCIHHNSKFYPNPYTFDPERFSDNNKRNINPITFMPFGIGPRNCIGSRFALCEMKVMAYQMLQQLELSPCERTTIPPKLDTSTFSIRLQGGNWLKISARK